MIVKDAFLSQTKYLLLKGLIWGPVYEHYIHFRVSLPLKVGVFTHSDTHFTLSNAPHNEYNSSVVHSVAKNLGVPNRGKFYQWPR